MPFNFTSIFSGLEIIPDQSLHTVLGNHGDNAEQRDCAERTQTMPSFVPRILKFISPPQSCQTKS
jgi:hypothetical protein